MALLNDRIGDNLPYGISKLSAERNAAREWTLKAYDYRGKLIAVCRFSEQEYLIARGDARWLLEKRHLQLPEHKE